MKRSSIRIWALCAILLMGSACTPTLKPLPPWPSTALQIPPAERQDASPCGPHLKGEPAIVAIQHDGVAGFFVSEKRLLCLTARSKVARECRPACEARVAEVRRGHDHILQTAFVVAGNREAQYQQALQQAQMRAIWQAITSGGICLVAGVFLGLGLGLRR